MIKPAKAVYQKTVLLSIVAFFLVGSLLCLPVNANQQSWTILQENQSDTGWGDFHFQIFQIFETNPIDNVSFCDSTSNCQDPVSSQYPSVWNIDNDNKAMGIYFLLDPVLPGETASFELFVSNPDNAQYGILVSPSVVPEPINYILFMTGSATLGYIVVLRRTRQQAG